MLSVAIVLLALVGAAGYCRWTGQVPAPLLEMLARRIQLPPGFKVELYATGVPNARSLTLGSGGTVFVGSRRAGKVYALVGNGRGDRASEVITIARGLNTPNGVAFHDGSLYVAEVSRVLRYDDIEARLKNPPVPVVVSTELPLTKQHEWRFIRFGPDGWLYVGVGAPCNVCESTDERVARILRMHADGSGMETYALGVRNSVGFDWQPESKEMWFTENGRDNMGDDIPPDELNYAPRAGMNFGFPYCHGKDIADPAIWIWAFLRGVCGSGLELTGACGGGGDAFLYGRNVSGGVPRRNFYRGAWFVESQRADWLPCEPGGGGGRSGCEV